MTESSESSVRPGQGDHVLTLCHMLANRIGRAFVGDMARHDVTIAEWRVLLTLALNGKASGKDITSRWAMDKMAISRAIQRLEGDGHISRDRNPSDLCLTRFVDFGRIASRRSFSVAEGEMRAR